MKLIQALGLDWRIFLAQFVNFAVLIFVLWRFAYKPIFNILEERRAKISEGLKHGEQAKKDAAEALSHKKEIISEAKQEASLIIEEARKKAEIKYQEIISKSKLDFQVWIDDEKKKIELEKEAAIFEVKKEMANLLTLALEKVLLEKIDQKKDGEIITKVIKDLS